LRQVPALGAQLLSEARMRGRLDHCFGERELVLKRIVGRPGSYARRQRTPRPG
jgi:hypothetical protein